MDKIIDALKFFNLEIKEISSRDLHLVYLGYKNKYENNIEMLNKIELNYLILKDIQKTNDAINNYLNPKVEEVKTEVVEIEENINKEEINETIKPKYDPYNEPVEIKDRPTVFGTVFALLIPLYGLFIFFFLRRITPKTAKFYLVLAIIGYIISFVMLFILIRQQ